MQDLFTVIVYSQPINLKKNNEMIRYDDVEPSPTHQEPVDVIKGWSRRNMLKLAFLTKTKICHFLGSVLAKDF